MKRFYCSLLLLLSFSVTLSAQEKLPTDYLSKEFHASRRAALRLLMPANSVTVIFAYPTRTFSKDVSYPYHQNPDLYYFSGYKEPNAVLLIFKEDQTGEGNKNYNELFFIQKRDTLQESWTGKRMGIDKVKSQLGFDKVFTGADFKNLPLNFSKFDKILFEAPVEDIADDPTDSADQYDLIKIFRQKAGIEKGFDADDEKWLGLFEQYGNMNSLHYFTENFNKKIDAGSMTKDHSFGDNLAVTDIMNISDSVTLNIVKGKIRSRKFNTVLYDQYTGTLRQVKTKEELNLVRKVVEISAQAHAETMKAIQPGMSELDLQAIQEYVHKRYGAEWVGYPSIVGAGENGCTLHYEENTKTNIGNEMVLMDVGAEYHGYSADVTRTVPSTGKFNPQQKAIYDLVYKAQEAVLKLCREGTAFDSTENKAKQVLADGLLELGILKTRDEINKYYPHGCSHFLGLDVHDKGIYNILLANMVITVEPGIYIPSNSACDKKWWGIAVRIEDDVLITKDGYELLSGLAPRKSEDVEKMVSQKSVLNDLVLPKLPGEK
ncbi:MAG: aminopeptidase P N-terminal domain-containing protein [Ferruginibacter sp.]